MSSGYVCDFFKGMCDDVQCSNCPRKPAAYMSTNSPGYEAVGGLPFPLPSPRYAKLRDILNEAFEFAARGKGEQRHGAGGKQWTEQRHVQIAKSVGMGFSVGQAMKKLEEGYAMPDWQACRREFLGAITYIASAIYVGDQGIDKTRNHSNDTDKEAA